MPSSPSPDVAARRPAPPDLHGGARRHGASSSFFGTTPRAAGPPLREAIAGRPRPAATGPRAPTRSVVGSRGGPLRGWAVGGGGARVRCIGGCRRRGQGRRRGGRSHPSWVAPGAGARVLATGIRTDESTNLHRRHARAVPWCSSPSCTGCSASWRKSRSAFGDATRDIITTNLGAGWLSAAVQLGLCVILFFTMPVMMNPVYEVAERLLHGKRYCCWLRWLLVMAVAFTAMYVPNFTDFLALVGSSVCVLVGFVLPGGAEMEWPGVVSDVLLVVIGLSLAVLRTYTSAAAHLPLVNRLNSCVQRSGLEDLEERTPIIFQVFHLGVDFAPIMAFFQSRLICRCCL